MKKFYSSFSVLILLCLLYSASLQAINKFPYAIRFDELEWYEKVNETTGEMFFVVDYQGWSPSNFKFEPNLVAGLNPFFATGITNNVFGGYVISPYFDLSETIDPYLTIEATGDFEIYLSTSKDRDNFECVKVISYDGFLSVKLNKNVKYIMIGGVGEITYARVFDRHSSVISSFPYITKFDKLGSFIEWTGQGYGACRIWDENDGPIVLYFSDKTISYLISPELDLSSLNNPCITSIGAMEMPNGFNGSCGLYASEDGIKYNELGSWELDGYGKKAPELISIPKTTKFLKIQPYSANSDFTGEYYISSLEIKEMNTEEVVHSDNFTFHNGGAFKWIAEGDYVKLTKWLDATTGQADIIYNNKNLEPLSDGEYYELSFEVSGGFDLERVDLFVDTKHPSQSEYYPNQDGQHTVSLANSSDFTITAKLKDGVNINEINEVIISNINIKKKSGSGIIDNKLSDENVIYFNKESEELCLEGISKGSYKTFIKAYDLQGQVLFLKETSESKLIIPMGSYSQDVIIVEVTNPETVITKKICK